MAKVSQLQSLRANADCGELAARAAPAIVDLVACCVSIATLSRASAMGARIYTNSDANLKPLRAKRAQSLASDRRDTRTH